jgi:hypothetical protein
LETIKRYLGHMPPAFPRRVATAGQPRYADVPIVLFDFLSDCVVLPITDKEWDHFLFLNFLFAFDVARCNTRLWLGLYACRAIVLPCRTTAGSLKWAMAGQGNGWLE